MYVTYFDEVKFDPASGQNGYIIGGLFCPMASVQAIDANLNALARDYFGNANPSIATEFHASHIFQGQGVFKGQDLKRRIALLQDLAKIIDAQPDLAKIVIRIIPENLVATSRPPENIAFMYFLEQVNQLLVEKGSHGMIFGDYDDSAIVSSIESLHHYRHQGTSFRQRIVIERIVDTVHFAKSHHSRMIQLVDFFTYCVQASHTEKSNPLRKSFVDWLRRETRLLQNLRAKIWPQEKNWYH